MTGEGIQCIADRALANGTARDMIIVTPNAMTVYGGSNYSSGATTGDWETFISEELVSYMDKTSAPSGAGKAAASRAIPWAATAHCGSA